MVLKVGSTPPYGSINVPAPECGAGVSPAGVPAAVNTDGEPDPWSNEVLGPSLAAGCHHLLAQEVHLLRVGLFERVENRVDSFVLNPTVSLDHECLIGIGGNHERREARDLIVR